jgi:Concanavalin A-like lectin/glucanases superfamily/Domain of unknown function (DUF2341)
MRSLVAILMLGGCVSHAPCKPRSVLVKLHFDSASAVADQLTVDLALAPTGVTDNNRTVTHEPGQADTNLEIDFSDGYPVGDQLTVTVTATMNSTTVGVGSNAMTLAAGCTPDFTVDVVGGGDLSSPEFPSSEDQAGSDLRRAEDAKSVDDLAQPPDALTSDAADASGPSAWRKSITINNTKVNGTQTDFPVWISLTAADLAAHARADGQGIYFTAADGTTALDYELQRWDASSQHLDAWVRVPTLSSTAPTTIYVQYGDPAGSVAPSPAGVFKSSFVAVWHFDDAAPASAIADATGTHPGTPTLTSTTQASATLGKGLSFNGSTDTITFTNPLSGSQAHTISVWVNQPSVTHVSTILVVGTAATGESRWLASHGTSAVLYAGTYNNDWSTTTDIDNAGWTLVHWVCEGSNGKNHFYVNGAEISGSPTTLTGVNTQGASGIIGYAPEPAYGTTTGLVGTIDELRIATVARSAGWIATEHANQGSPITFYSIGAEEVVH